MKKLISLFLTLFVASSVWADNEWVVDGIKYVAIDSHTARVVANDYKGDITIPAVEKKYYKKVEGCYGTPFRGCSELTSVTFENNDIDFGDYAFENCSNLTSVTVLNSSSSFDIEEYAFKGCGKLTSVSLQKVHEIDDYAFADCTNLTSISLPNYVYRIGAHAFDGCSNLTDIKWPHFISKIGDYAFRGCSNLTSVIIGGESSYVELGKYAFDGCSNLTSVSIESGISEIPDYAFRGCSNLSSVSFPEYDLFTKIGVRAFYGCKSLDTITIPQSVTSIGISSFNGCSNLSSVSFGGVKYIPDSAFYNCNLKSVPHGISSIGKYAFFRNDIQPLIIPETVKTIKEWAFSFPSKVFFLATTPPNGDKNLIVGSWTKVYVPCESVNLYRISGFIDWQVKILCICNVSLSANDNLFGTVEGSGIYGEGGIVSLVATPAEGYRFVQWSDGNTENPRTITLEEDINLEAVFKMVKTVSLDVNDNALGTVEGAGEYVDGSLITIVATPAEGYKFVQWNDGNTENPRTITVDSDVNYTATFQEIPIYNIVLESNDISLGTVNGSGEYAEGSLITIVATPAEGYKFVQWNDGNTENPRTITVDSDVSYTATFQEIPVYNIVLEPNDASLGTVRGGGQYKEGKSVSIAADPESGCKFIQWNDGNSQNPRIITVTADKDYIAIFEKISTAISEVSNATAVTIVNGQILVNGEAPAFVVTVSGQKIANANLKAGVYFVVAEGKTVKVKI